MEQKQLEKIEGWFGKMNKRFDDTNHRLENRFTALLQVCTNIRKDIESIRGEISSLRKYLGNVDGKYEARMSTIELAVKELERRLPY